MSTLNREKIEKMWVHIGALPDNAIYGASLNPKDGEALVEAGVITQKAVTDAVRKRMDATGAKSYTLLGFPVSFIPGLPEGRVVWIGKYHTAIAVTDENGVVRG